MASPLTAICSSRCSIRFNNTSVDTFFPDHTGARGCGDEDTKVLSSRYFVMLIQSYFKIFLEEWPKNRIDRWGMVRWCAWKVVQTCAHRCAWPSATQSLSHCYYWNAPFDSQIFWERSGKYSLLGYSISVGKVSLTSHKLHARAWSQGQYE